MQDTSSSRWPRLPLRSELAGAFGIAAFFVATSARAAELDYRAFDGCPSRDAFVREVETRTKWSPSKVHEFVVQLEQNGERVRATFVVKEGGVAGEPRVIEGATCDEAMRAIALSVALAMEGEPVDPPATPIAIVAPPVAPTAAEAPPSPPSSSSIEFGLGLDVELLGYAATGAVLAGAVSIDVRPFPILDLRASFVRSLEPSIDVGPTHSSLVWTTGRFEPCVGDFHLGAVGVGPCVFVEVGQMQAKGTSSEGTLWASIGAVGRAEVPIAGPVSLRSSFGPFVPLDRTRISYGDAYPVYRAPAVGLFGTFGIAAKL